MATTQFLTRTAEDMIYGAFRLLKKIRAGDTLEQDEIDDALEVLQDMMRAWEVSDTPLFKKERIQLTLIANRGMYEIGATPYFARDVHHIQYLDDAGADYSLDLMPGQQYLQLPNKDNTGQPVQYWFDRSPSSYLPSAGATDVVPEASKLYLWPKPSTNTVSNNGVLQIQVSVPFAVPQVVGDDLDVPQSWYKALRYLLAAELFEEYGGNDVRVKAASLWEEVLDDYRPAFVDFEQRDVKYG